jgi:hypothetical protein
MTAIQLEFNFENKSDVEIELGYVKKQLADIQESTGKVRRKLFAEMGELRKEVQELKDLIRSLHHEKIEWVYGQEGCLFDVSKHKKTGN